MVLVQFKKIKNHYDSLIISGHAEFAKKGQDLVCAGISAIAFGALNGFNELAPNNFDIVVADNLITVSVVEQSETVEQLMNFTKYQFKTVYAHYPEYINIKVTEV